jgi:isoleucyl-tRNA synthetase
MAQDAAQNPPERAPLFPKIEEEVIAHWSKHHIFERSLKERSEKKGYVFYDGPPFATGLPHYGHLLQSAIKDAVPRYWTMKGYHVPRTWGWDCHGLPIENLIEKELRLSSKKDIETFGIDKFNAACRASIFTYEKEWGKYVERLGRWVDFENSYKTMDNDFIESVWWAFSELHKKEFVYKGLRVSLYCPRCATPLSNFEIAMGNSYVDREDPAIYLKFPVLGEHKTYLVAWTTTPWSVPGITGLAVHPDLMYAAVKIQKTGETLIFAEVRQAEVLKEFYPIGDTNQEQQDFEVVAHFKGRDLIGKRFEAPYHFLPVEGDAYRVIAGAHVSADAGTGIVTTAPAFGEEDLLAAQESGLPILFTVDDEGRFVRECGPFAGMKVKEADPLIVKDLQEKGFLHREEKIKHSVAVCWRCNTLLLYKAQSAWFVDVTKLKTKMLKTAEKISWHPEHFKDGRFGKGLETAPDWNISRTRYWGSPIPVWECGSCQAQTIIGSVAELKKKATSETWPQALDLHRPHIDTIKIACACGGEQTRIPEVFDCWVESGSMPFASVHYPFENKKWFEEHFPADFIAEAQDQTRGWFYTLHVLATALFGKPAFTNAIVTGLLLAEDGKKMSKSLKNYPDPWHVLTTYGADALRYYFFTSSVVEADSLNFSERDLQTIVRGVMNLVWNVKSFYDLYAGSGVRLEKPRSAHVLDRWLFSRCTELLAVVTKNMDAYELARAARPIREFIDDLSTWWLRRSRDRFKSENTFERADALKTLREVLEELSKIMAPFTPFLAEKIYLDIGGQKASVHLEKWPKVEDRLLDERLLSDMKWIREAVSAAHELRGQSKIPVRQTLAKLTIHLADSDLAVRLQRQDDLLSLIRDEVNVEQVDIQLSPGLEEGWRVELDTVITPELKRKGWLREFVRHGMNLRKEAGCNPADRIALSVMLPEGELRDALEQGKEQIRRELKADTLEWTLEVPATSRALAHVKMDGQEVKMGVK